MAGLRRCCWRGIAGGRHHNPCGPGPAKPIHVQPPVTGASSFSVAARRCCQDYRRGRPGSAGRSIRPSPNGLPAVRLQQIRLGLPGCPRNSTRRESEGSLRNLSLQLRRHRGLGLFPDQHGAPDEGRTEPAGICWTAGPTSILRISSTRSEVSSRGARTTTAPIAGSCGVPETGKCPSLGARTLTARGHWLSETSSKADWGQCPDSRRYGR